MKKTLKIIGSAAAAAILVLAPFSITAEAASEDYSYEVQGSDVVITKYLGEDEELLIPASLDGNKVTVLGSGSFQMNPDITSVEIPNGVTTISDHAFAIDSGLETVTIPATVTSIGEKAFQQCSSLTTINFEGDESAWSAITVDVDNELLTTITPNFNATLTEQADDASAASEAESEAVSSTEESSSETASSEAESEAAAVSSEDSSAATTTESTTESAADTSSVQYATTSTTVTVSSVTVPKGLGVNLAYVIGGILIGIAVLDIIYFSINKPKDNNF